MRWQADVDGVSVADIKIDLPTTRWAYDTWHHVALTSDGTTHALLVDGTCIGACTARIANWDFNTGDPIVIGNITQGTIAAYGYIDELRITKGVARYSAGRYTVPTEPFTADANTKLLIQSDFSEGGLGADHSGNYNYFTPTNLVASDMMLDSPMNNFCTLSPLVRSYNGGNPTFSEGNLKSTCTTAGGVWVAGGPSTFAMRTGKWYWEWYCNSITASNGAQIGIVGSQDTRFWHAGQHAFQGNSQIAWEGIQASNKVNIDTIDTSYSDDTYETGDVCGVALDLDSGTPTVTFYLNGVTRGALNLSLSNLANQPFIFASINSFNAAASVTFNFGQDSSFAGVLTAQGNQDGNDKGDFYYAPPSGFLALCTDNLADPTVDSLIQGNNHFKPFTYTGDGAASRAITGVGFAPGFAWAKNTASGSNGFEMDRVRGDGTNLKGAFSSDGEGEQAHATQFKTLDSDGFTVGSGDIIMVSQPMLLRLPLHLSLIMMVM